MSIGGGGIGKGLLKKGVLGSIGNNGTLICGGRCMWYSVGAPSTASPSVVGAPGTLLASSGPSLLVLPLDLNSGEDRPSCESMKGFP